MEDGDHADDSAIEGVEDPVWKAVKCGSANTLVDARMHLRMLAYALKGRFDLQPECIAEAGLTFVVPVSRASARSSLAARRRTIFRLSARALP